MSRRRHRLPAGAGSLHSRRPHGGARGKRRTPRNDRENFGNRIPNAHRSGGEIVTGPAELQPVDGLTLSAEHRAALRPGEAVTDEQGVLHHLPRFFFQVPSWEEAHGLRVAAHFALSELTTVDSR